MTKNVKIFAISSLVLLTACSQSVSELWSSSVSEKQETVIATIPSYDQTLPKVSQVKEPQSVKFIASNNHKEYTFFYDEVETERDSRYLPPASKAVREPEPYKVKPLSGAYQKELNTMINYANQLRAKKGLAPLQVDQNLMAAAQRRAEELVGRYSHTRPDGSEVASLFYQNVGFGENISAGQSNAQLAMKSFEESKSHYSLIVNEKFTKTGVGLVYSQGSPLTYYWVQLFTVDGVESRYTFDNPTSDKLAEVITKDSNINDRTNWLIVDNFPIRLQQIQPNRKWYSFSQTDGVTTYDGLINGDQDLRFGLAQKKGTAHRVFYRGNNTAFANVPKRGSAAYQGKGLITDGRNSRYINAAFQADFSNNQLNGVLSENGVKIADIQAIIRGKSIYSPSGARIEIRGGFFGAKGREIGGVFYDHQTGKYGVFGVNK